MIKKIVDIVDAGKRLDLFLLKYNPGYSRSYFNKMIKSAGATVNEQSSKSSYAVKVNDEIRYTLTEEVLHSDQEPENIPLNIIFENEDAIVINKQAGLVVHPAKGNRSGTLINALLYHFPKIKESVYEKGNEISESRPGLVHRLDKDTSGVMIVAKNTKEMIFLASEIKERKAEKTYLALCFGWPKTTSGRLIHNLGRNPENRKTYTKVASKKGREAISNYQVIDFYQTLAGERLSLIEFKIETGRTHQIRSQSKLAGFPVIGDQAYFTRESKNLSGKLGAKRQMLHSHCLKIKLTPNSTASDFTAEFPTDFQKIISGLKIIK